MSVRDGMVVLEVGGLDVLDDRVLGRACSSREARPTRARGRPRRPARAPGRPTTGRFLFALAASQAGVEVLEIGGSRGYSSIWPPGARVLGGRLVSLEKGTRALCHLAGEHRRCGARGGPSSSRAMRTRPCAGSRTSSTSSSWTPEKDDYETLFALARPLLEPGALVVADNVLSHAETLAAYSEARQADETLSASPSRSTGAPS